MKSHADRSRRRNAWYSSSQAAVSRVMFVALRPAASSPNSTGSASRKSPVDKPRRYSTGSTSATCGDRRMYGGRTRLVNRGRSPSSPTPRSFTRGARTRSVPAPQVTARDCARPLRTTSRRPVASPASAMRVDVLLDLRHQGRRQHARALPGLLHPGSARRPPRPRRCLRAPGRVPSTLGGVSFPRPASQGVFLFNWKDMPPASRLRSITFGYISSSVSSGVSRFRAPCATAVAK